MREAGLAEVLAGFGKSGRLVLCTRRGLRAVGHGELPLARFSAATANHTAVLARVGVQLERGGQRVLSEREIFARERAEGKRLFSAELPGGRCHRPDLILLGDPQVAIEVELTDKSARRLDALLRAWRRAVARGQFGRVHYLCSAKALPYVERAASRTRIDGLIDIEPLASPDGQLALAAGSPLLRCPDDAAPFSTAALRWDETDPANVLQRWASRSPSAARSASAPSRVHHT